MNFFDDQEPKKPRATKIIATLGPASKSAQTVADMIEAGLDVARINFSHVNDPQEVKRLVELVHQGAVKAGREITVLADLCGPKMRLRNVPGEACKVEEGEQFVLYPIGGPGIDNTGGLARFAVSIPTLCEDVRPGERVLIADGRISGVVDAVTLNGVVVTVDVGGVIEERKGVNLPDTKLQGTALTAKDITDIKSGLDAGVDVFALSFVRNSSDIAQLKECLPEGMPVIGKIERPEALENFEEIRDASDGVMIARGDLGVEVGWEHLPGVQMDLVASALDHGRLSIVATEMLESMTVSKRPTRAEVTDVAAAVMNGASAVMLSAESAMGGRPTEVVKAMDSILASIETHTRYKERNYQQLLGPKTSSRSAAVAVAGTRLARNVDAQAIVTVANTGATARLLSATRPHRPIVALCEKKAVSRSLALWWGVKPCWRGKYDTLNDDVIKTLVEETLGPQSGCLVVVSGVTGGSTSDTVRIIDI